MSEENENDIDDLIIDIDNQQIKIIVAEKTVKGEKKEAYILAKECDYTLLIGDRDEDEKRKLMIDVLKEHIISFHGFKIRGQEPVAEDFGTYPFSFVQKCVNIYTEAMSKINEVSKGKKK